MSAPFFLNTRPLKQGQALNQYLIRHQWPVYHLPLLELFPLSLSAAQQREFMLMQQYTHVVVISPTAATLGLQCIEQYATDDVASLPIVWLAIGQATARVLAEAGIFAQTPAQENSEGLQAHLQLPQKSRVMLWAGEGGRTLIQNHLMAQHIDVYRIALYQRKIPSNVQQHWQTIGQMPKVVLISSLDIWQAWHMLAGQQAFKPLLLVLGERTAQQICAQAHEQTPQIKVLQNLHPEHILQTLNDV